MTLIPNNLKGGESQSDTLKKRYIFKLLTNFVGLPISLITQAIIPRCLGPMAYGDFNFLTSFFTQLVNFLDMGTSIGFYTKLSQRPRETTLVSFYLYFSGINAGVIFGIVILAQLSGTFPLIWPSQKLPFIYLAAGWGVLAWIVQVFEKMVDAFGLTVSGELARIAQKFLGLALLVTLYGFHQLHLTSFFFYYYFIFTFMIVISIKIMGRKDYSLKLSKKLPWSQIKSYAKEFFRYGHPLFVYSLVGMLGNIFDRWFLQVFDGSLQQGFYGLSVQIGTICILFTSAMTPLLTRELSIAFGKKDINQMAYLFRRYVPSLYSVAAFISCFVATQADKIIRIMGGSNFQGALVAVTIMAFYPIYQTYGQLSGSVFYATGQTALYRNIGIIFCILGLPLTYLLLAPAKMMGLEAGATGLAIKMVAIQIVGINVQLYFVSRLLGLPFRRLLGHQFLSLSCFLAVAWMISHGLNSVRVLHDQVVFSFLLAGCAYTAIILALTYLRPGLFALERQDLVALEARFWGK